MSWQEEEPKIYLQVGFAYWIADKMYELGKSGMITRSGARQIVSVVKRTMDNLRAMPVESGPLKVTVGIKFICPAVPPLDQKGDLFEVHTTRAGAEAIAGELTRGSGDIQDFF